MTGFSITEEQIENGEVIAASSLENGLSLRSALALLYEFDAVVNCIEGNDSDVSSVRWVTVYGTNLRTGISINRSIHFPQAMTKASRTRVFNAIMSY